MRTPFAPRTGSWISGRATELGGKVYPRVPVAGILESERSITGQYLSGKRRIAVPAERTIDPAEDSGQWRARKQS